MPCSARSSLGRECARQLNPLLAFDTVKQDNQLANIQAVDHFLAAAKAGTLQAVSWIVPEQR